MDFEQILMAYIKPELLVLIPILWYIGTKIKATNHVEDYWIPFMLMFISVIAALSYILIFEGYDARGMWVGIMQGIAIACAEGWLYQAKKQVASRGR